MPSAAEQEVEYKVGLHIEQDSEMPVPLVQVALEEDPNTNRAIIHVVATNWAASDTGAQAVASLLRQTARAIEHELGVGETEGKTIRPRFNPQPHGKQGGK